MMLIAGVIVLFLLLVIFFSRNGTITFDRGSVLYLLLLGFSPVLQNIGGLATLRLDELFFPIFLIFFLIMLLVRAGKFPLIPKAFRYTWGAYLTLTFLAMLVQNLIFGQESLVPFAYMLRILYLTAVFCVFFIYLTLNDDKRLQTTYVVLVVSLGISLVGIMQYFDIGSTRSFILEYYPRITTFVPRAATSVFSGNPTILGTFLLIPISYLSAYLLVLSEKTIHKLFLWILLLILSFCLFLTASKMAILTFLALLLLIWVLGPAKKVRSLFIILSICLVVLYLINTFAPYVFERIVVSLEGSTEGRITTWVRLSEQIFATPLVMMFGYGFHTRVGVITDSQYFYELFHKGILGLIGYVIFLLGNFRYFIGLYLQEAEGSYDKAIYLGTCGMLFAMTMVGFTYTTLQPERVPEWIFIMLALAYASVYRSKKRQQN